MSHRVIIINSTTPPGPTALAAGEAPEFEVEVTFHPNDSLTPAQIGNEVARIQRKVDQIIGGDPD